MSPDPVSPDIARTRQLPTGQELIVRRALPDDAERLVAFLEQASGQTPFLTFGPGEFDRSVEGEREFIAAAQARPNCIVLLAEVDGVIAGHAHCLGPQRPRIRHAVELGISVGADYWGLGIGSDLMNALLEWAERSGVVRKVNLEARADNVRAIALYERLGFVMEGRRSRGNQEEGQFHDIVLMGREIEPRPGSAAAR